MSDARAVYSRTMRSSLTTRVSRAGFGLMAIWCLGCTSFDVMIDVLLRGETTRAGCVMAGEAQAPIISGVSAVQTPSSDDSSGCGCDHCVAVQANATEVTLDPQATPETAQRRLGSALSVEREPLVPPPIAYTAI